MGRSEELSDFQRGTVIGCHLSDKSVREISALLALPRSTVSAVIVKWKRLGATTAQARSGRPHKLTERDRRTLSTVASKNRLSSVAKLTTELQTACGSDVSTRTVRRELCEMGFRGRAAAHKPKISRRKAKRRPELQHGLSAGTAQAPAGETNTQQQEVTHQHTRDGTHETSNAEEESVD